MGASKYLHVQEQQRLGFSINNVQQVIDFGSITGHCFFVKADKQATKVELLVCPCMPSPPASTRYSRFADLFVDRYL
jgi:hypothetical protein